ncbi:MAG: DUF2442 domain-containing protein [Opitutaceae bacterium]|nr:DUF2442 domain-containing protein [Opitutaceae bacterium]
MKRHDDMIAVEVAVQDGQIWLRLLDGSTHSFPAHYYPRLAAAAPAQLTTVRLRVGGRALRWDEIDEDIWVKDAVLGRYPFAYRTVATG